LPYKMLVDFITFDFMSFFCPHIHRAPAIQESFLSPGCTELSQPLHSFPFDCFPPPHVSPPQKDLPQPI
jgi:hypothetical protein